MFKRIGRRGTAGRKRKIAGLSALVLAAVIGVGAYAFTATNEVPESNAGVGVNVVKPYDITNVEYEPEAGNRLEIAKVKFELNEAASSVIAALTSSATPVSAEYGAECTELGAPTKWECPVIPIEIKEAAHLSVAAVSGGKV